MMILGNSVEKQGNIKYKITFILIVLSKTEGDKSDSNGSRPGRYI